jgi:hypothetical protein
VNLRLFLCCLLAAPVFGDEVPGTLVELGSFERLEASGVSYASGRLAVVDDTLNSLFLFDAGGRFLSKLDSDSLPAARAKFEDLAFHPATKTHFAVGSHEGWTDETLRELSVLLEFRLDRFDAIDRASTRQLPLWEGFQALGLWKPKSMKIEGLAIDDSGHTLFVGLREPSDRARVYSVSLALLRAGEPAVSLFLEFDAGDIAGTPYCISALTWAPTLGGLLIATSTEQDPSHRFLGNRLWFVRAQTTASPVLVWDRFDEGMKAEGLALGAGKLFIVYDNDQDDTGIPSQLRVVPFDAVVAKLRPDSGYVTP